MRFEYPINIICFNRPDYLEQLIISLKNQTLLIAQENIYFWIDGYLNSKDQFLGRPNRTSDTVKIILKHFPQSKLTATPVNLGIAHNYWRAELNSFEVLNAKSAFFIEEDMQLSPKYFEILIEMDSKLSEDLDVSHLSPTGDISHSASDVDSQYQAFGHNWGYLLRAWHHFERKELLEEYLTFISLQPYYQRMQKEFDILEHFYSKGVLIAGTSQDGMKDGLRNFFRRVSVTTKEVWASNIGIVGEHFQEQTDHHNRQIEKHFKGFPDLVGKLNKAVLFGDGVSKTTSQVFNNYLRHLRLLLLDYNSLKVEHDALKVEHDALKVEHDALKVEHDALKVEHDALKHSTIWMLSHPLRWLITKGKVLLRRLFK
jgi:hypothetical protein